MQLTSTECFWLCVNWEEEQQELKLTADMSPEQMNLVSRLQDEIVKARVKYARLSAEEKLQLAEQGIYSEKDYELWQRNGN